MAARVWAAMAAHAARRLGVRAVVEVEGAAVAVGQHGPVARHPGVVAGLQVHARRLHAVGHPNAEQGFNANASRHHASAKLSAATVPSLS